MNTLFQFSVWSTFVNRIYDGNLRVSAHNTSGNIELGSFDSLDGGVCHLRGDGTSTEAASTIEVVYEDAPFSGTEIPFSVEKPLSVNL